jgi:hypothetical protein
VRKAEEAFADAYRVGRATPIDQGLGQLLQELRAGLFLGQPHRGFEDGDGALEGPASKRRPPDPLEQCDGLLVADEIGSKGMLGRLCLQAPAGQEGESTGVETGTDRGPEVVVESLAKERMGELDPADRCGANQPTAIESIEGDTGLALVQVGQLYRQIGAKAGPQHRSCPGATQTFGG